MFIGRPLLVLLSLFIATIANANPCVTVLRDKEPLFLFSKKLPRPTGSSWKIKTWEVSEPKEWQASEISSLTKHLYEIRKQGLTIFFDQITEAGPIAFFRAKFGTRLVSDSDGKPTSIPEPKLAALHYRLKNSIHFHDSYFDPNAGKISFGDTLTDRSEQIMLLHELAHAFDHKSLQYNSSNETFLKLSGWESSGKLKNVDEAEIQRVWDESVSLNKKGLTTEAHNLAKNFAHAHGFPTLYAMMNPSETYAEMVSFISLAPDAPKYLNPELITWFKTNVLK